MQGVMGFAREFPRSITKKRGGTSLAPAWERAKMDLD